MPGKTDSREAQFIHFPLSSISSKDNFDEGGGEFSFSYKIKELEIGWYVDYRIPYEKDTIELIYVDIGAHKKIGFDKGINIFGDPSFVDFFEIFTLPQILTTYGKPSEVLISLSAHFTPNWHPFDILLIYPEVGIFVEYTAWREPTDDMIIGCPLKAHITMWLVSPGNEAPYDEILSGMTEWNFISPDFSEYKSIEEATSMTLDEFYQIFKHPSDTCLETPAELWPDP
jgi:hypothetical protein